MNLINLYTKVEESNARGAWARGVRDYALFLLSSLDLDYDPEVIKAYQDGDTVTRHNILLRGAADWIQYSYGGMALIYDRDICKTLCNRTEAERVKQGERQPNPRETWMDVQARALYQAEKLIDSIIEGDR